MARAHVELLHEVRILLVAAACGLGADDALAAATLHAVRVRRQALDVAAAADREHHLVLGDQVRHLEFLGLGALDHGAPVVAELLLQLDGVLADDVEHQALVGEDRLEAVDLVHQLGELGGELVDLQARQLDQAQRADGLGLHAREARAVGLGLGDHAVRDLRRVRMRRRDAEGAGHEPLDRFLAGLRGADDADHLVDVADRVDQAFQLVRLLLRLAQEVRGAPADDFLAVLDVEVDQAAQGQGARLAVHQRDVDDAERVLERRELVELLLHHRRVGVLLEHHHDARLRVAAGVVLDVGDVRDAVVAAGLDDLLDEVRLHHLVGDLVDDDGVARAVLLEVHLAAHRDAAAPGGVGLHDAAAAHDASAGREVRPRHPLEEFLEPDGGVVDGGHDGVAHLAQVVRGHAARHAHGDAARAVDEEVRELRREHGGLLQAVVVVRLERDGVLVEVLEERHRGGGHARLGVTHGGRRVALDGAEVALLVHEQRARLPRLAHVDERGIDDALAVRVVVAAGVAADLGALDLLAPGGQVEVVHRHQDAALRGLQAVTDVGQGPVHDGAHGIRQVAVVELALDLDVDEAIDRRDGVFWSLCHGVSELRMIPASAFPRRA